MRALLLRKGVQAAEQSKEDPFRSAELRFLRYFDLASPEPKEPPAQIPLAPPPAERPAVPANLAPELRDRLARLEGAPLPPELKKAALESMRKLRETMPAAPLTLHTFYGRDRRPGPGVAMPVPSPPAEIFYIPGDPRERQAAALLGPIDSIDYVGLPGAPPVDRTKAAADWERLKEIRVADIRPPGEPLALQSGVSPMQMQDFHEGLARAVDESPAPATHRLAWHPMKVRASDFKVDYKFDDLDSNAMRFKDPGPFIVEKVRARCIHCGPPAGGALVAAQRVAPESRCLACAKPERAAPVAAAAPPPRPTFLDDDSQEFGPQCAPCSGALAARQRQIPGLRCAACTRGPLGSEPTRYCQRRGQPGATAAEREAQRSNEDAPRAVPALPDLCQRCGAPCSAGVRALQLQDPSEPCAACAGRAS